MSLESPNDEVAELVTRKRYFAGGNARWMFAMTELEMMADIQYHLRFESDGLAIQVGYVGVNSVQSRNHLMIKCKSNSNDFLAIKYVASQILDSCEATVYRMEYTLAESQANPGFMGRVVEFEFIWQMMQNRNACKTEMCSFRFVPQDVRS